jgi:hypothetical protein
VPEPKRRTRSKQNFGRDTLWLLVGRAVHVSLLAGQRRLCSVVRAYGNPIADRSMGKLDFLLDGTATGQAGSSNGGFNVRPSPDLTACGSQSGYGPNFASIYPKQVLVVFDDATVNCYVSRLIVIGLAP